MPKLKKKILTKVMYTYVTPAHDRWIRRTAKKCKMSRSMFIHHMIEASKKAFVLAMLFSPLLGCGKGNTVPALVEVWGDWQTQVISGSAAHNAPVQFTHNGQTLGYCTLQTNP